MTLDNKTCLICDDVAVIEVISVQMQAAPLCAAHWADYCAHDGGLTADEVRKWFDDGARGDKPRPLPYVIDRGRDALRTDDDRGVYRTDEHESG